MDEEPKWYELEAYVSCNGIEFTEKVNLRNYLYKGKWDSMSQSQRTAWLNSNLYVAEDLLVNHVNTGYRQPGGQGEYY